MAADALPGWYGKLPSLGDFATRRLPPLFVEPWDGWLAAGLGQWRERDPGWVEAFLAAPIWRFALGAGLPFPASPGYVGVLMPSVDRIGRYFPLTVARARGAAEAAVPSAWLQAVRDAALAALDGDWSGERLDAELAALDPPAEHGPPWPARGRGLWWREGPDEPLATVGLPATVDLFGAVEQRS